jgi:hypothetical protein
MHACPRCGYDCDCDGEDLWNDDPQRRCYCPCEEDPEDEHFERDDDDGRADARD